MGLGSTGVYERIVNKNHSSMDNFIYNCISQVTLSYREDYSGFRGAVRLGDRLGLTVINTGILLVGEPPHYVYNRFDRLPRKTFYWYLPEQFLGDKVSAIVFYKSLFLMSAILLLIFKFLQF